MIFRREKSQEQLDAAFLEAVGDHNFEKAKKLLAKGANVLARDAEENTALHRLAGCAMEKWISEVDEFLCLLLDQGIGINAQNKKAQTCLHLIVTCEEKNAWVNSSPREMMRIFLGRGADPTVRDVDGSTPLHLAARAGEVEMVKLLLECNPSLISVHDNAGNYPYQSALLGSVPHHQLSRDLHERLDARNRKKQKIAAGEEPSPAVVSGGWILTEDEEVACIRIKEKLGYRLTEMFNFHARTYTQITHNLETNAEGTTVKSFDDFSDKTLIEEAYRELTRLGGRADEGAIYNRILDKQKHPAVD